MDDLSFPSLRFGCVVSAAPLTVCVLADSPTQRSFCSRCGSKRCSGIDESNAASLLFPPFPAQLWFSGLKGSDPLKESHSSFGASVVAQSVRNPPTVQETWFQSLGRGGSPGEGIAHHPPQRYSCLGNPMDRGALWALAHVVVKSRRRLRRRSTHARVLMLQTRKRKGKEFKGFAKTHLVSRQVIQTPCLSPCTMLSQGANMGVCVCGLHSQLTWPLVN